MNRGRGRQLAGLVAIGVALAVVGVVTLQHLGETQAYADAVAAAATLEQDHLDGYLLCALPGVTASQLTSATRVQTLFERAGERLGKRHAATIRACEGTLEALTAATAKLPVPPDLAQQHAALSGAAEQLAVAHAGYQRYLDDASKPYDFAEALPYVEKLGLAFQSFHDANAALTHALNAEM